MKYYIATKLERHQEHNAVRDRLAREGHELTYDWTTHGPVYRDGLARIKEVCHAELEGILNADFIIVLLPGGRGTHVELGFALAVGKPVLAHVKPGGAEHDMFAASSETCAFYHHKLVTHCVGYAQLYATVDALEDISLLKHPVPMNEEVPAWTTSRGPCPCGEKSLKCRLFLDGAHHLIDHGRMNADDPGPGLYCVTHNGGGLPFVKEYNFWLAQGGLTQPWGRHWRKVRAANLEAARAMADKERHLPLNDADFSAHFGVSL